MNTKSIFYLLTLIFLAYALPVKAQIEGENVKLPYNKTEYTLLKSGKGQKSKLGDYLQFSFLVKGNNGQILADRRDPEDWITEQVVEIDSNTRAEVEMLYSIKVGDSTVLKVPITEEQKAPGMEQIDTIVWLVKLERILDEATLKKDQEEKQAEAIKKAEKARGQAEEINKQTTALLADFVSGKLDGKIQKTASGLEYYIIQKGTGAKVKKDDKVSVAYHGVFQSDGKVFDSSYQRGDDIQFNAGQGQMIKGWDEAMLLLNGGDKAILFIPYDLAYGEEGRPPQIPAKSNLVFFIEVISAKSSK